MACPGCKLCEPEPTHEEALALICADRDRLAAQLKEALGEISRMTQRPAAEIIEAERERMERLDETERRYWRAIEAIEFLRNEYSSLGARACPACVYEDGRF